jgi:hypothetical protein
LHPLMTSNPMICQTPQSVQTQHDTMLLVLYGANLELINGLIDMFATNLLQENRGAGEAFSKTVHTLVASKEQGLDYARAVLLLLLNVDQVGKTWVCKGFPNSRIEALCGNKAPGFFTALAHDIVPNWQRNEAHNVQQLVHRARSAYLVA